MNSDMRQRRKCHAAARSFAFTRFIVVSGIVAVAGDHSIFFRRLDSLRALQKVWKLALLGL